MRRIGAILTHRGDITEARTHLDAAAGLVAAGHGPALASGVVAETPWVWLDTFSAWNWWLHGEEDRAEDLVAAAVAAGEGVGAAYGTLFAVWFSVLVATLRHDHAAVLARCERGIELATSQGFAMFVPYMLVSRGWAVAVSGEPEVGRAELVGASAAIAGSGARMMVPVFPAFHADACLRSGRPGEALAATTDGLALLEETGERWYEAELLRLRAEALATIDPADPAALEAAHRAVAVATAQGAWGLQRAAEATLTSVKGLGPPR